MRFTGLEGNVVDGCFERAGGWACNDRSLIGMLPVYRVRRVLGNEITLQAK